METFKANDKWNNAFVRGLRVRALYKGGATFFQRPLIAITLMNILTNGSLETNTTGWTGSGTLTRIALPTPAHGESGTWCGQNNHRVNGAHYAQHASVPVVHGNRYYIRCWTRCSTSGYGNVLTFMNNATALSGVSTTTMTANQWTLCDGIWQANAVSLILRLQFSGGNGNQQRTAQFDNVMAMNLTQAFGSGNEPTAAEMRNWVTYFDGATTIQL